jgi:hypothetical protein
MTDPPIRNIVHALEFGAAMALLMATFSGYVLGAAKASLMLGPLSCIGG